MRDYMRVIRGGGTHQKPEERSLQEVHLRRDEARSLPPLVLWDWQTGLHAQYCEGYGEEYRQCPDPECPAEADTLKQGLEEKWEGESYVHGVRSWARRSDDDEED